METTKGICGLIIDLRERGPSLREIGKIVNKSHATVQYIINRKGQGEKGYVYKYELNFRDGVLLMESKPHIKMPIPIVVSLGLLMVFTITLHAFLNADTINFLDELINYGFSSILLCSMLCAIQYRKEIHDLSRDVDSWVEFVHLEKETEEIRTKAKLLGSRFSTFHMILITTGGVAYCLVPVGKYLYLHPSNPMDLLIFPCWTPFQMDTNWGFYSTYFIQAIIIYFANLAFARVFCYQIICLITIGHQIKLISTALSTLEQRVAKLVSEKRSSKIKGNFDIHFIREQEFNKCAKHFLNVYRATKDATNLFRQVTSLVYHFGMWVICATGVKVAIEQQHLMKVQIFMLLNTILVHQYIYSVGTEYLKNEVEELRITTYSYPWYKMQKTCRKNILLMIISTSYIPSFNTYLGTETSLENFGKIINGSYYYISLLLTILRE